jgi:serine/threonine-protein kinase
VSDTVAQLSAALADRYRIERELGRGGMATVYLVQDLKHDRPVALKVLHPEIAAGLGPERFLREIRLTARLQHPHILPVFDSGAVAGRPWYTMPYIRGESLRDRLRREVQLPVETAVEITRQVAHALEYAHREGTVHRDIKPENVLLSEGQALVADFGVARAIGAAGDESLTGTGLAIGTPSYMAPEQASGGPVDGRTDVYALGCVLYEMLAGEPPFTGRTPQAIVAKRFAHPAPSVLIVRPNVPRMLDDAIRKAMATVPADRFATAAQFAQALEASSASHAATEPATAVPERKLSRRRVLVGGVIALGVLAAMAGGYMTLRGLGVGSPRTLLSTGMLKQRERILIADLQSRTPDSLLGLAASEALRTDFAQSSVVTIVPATEVAEVLQRMRRPATERLDRGLAREVAIRQGIKAMVTGEVTAIGQGYLVSVQLVSPQSGEVLAAEREAAEDVTKIVPAIDRLSKRLRGRIGEPLRSLRSEPRLEEVTTSSLEALWKYTQAIQAGDIEREFGRGIPLLEEAVALDTSFATAWRVLGGYLLAVGERERGVEAFKKAIQYRDRLTDLERGHTLAIYYQFVTGELDKAAAAYRAVLDRHPDDGGSLNNLSGIYNTLGQPARAETLLRRLITLDSLKGAELGRVPDNDANSFIGLAFTQLGLGKVRQAELTFQRAVERYGNINSIESSVLLHWSAVGKYTSAESLGTVYLEKYTGVEDLRYAMDQLAQIASARGRLALSERRFREAMELSAKQPNATAYLEDAVSLGFLDIWFRRQPRRGLETVEAALRRYPLASLKPMDRPYLPLAVAYAVAGKPQKARELLAEYEREVPHMYRRTAETFRLWAWGQVAMAEGRIADAVSELQAFASATASDCRPCGLAALAQAYDRAGQVDSAIATYERYVRTPHIMRLAWVLRLGNDGTQLAPAHMRLGELYEQRADRDRARHHYARFVELWRECDPELRPAVTEVKQRLRQLGGES